MNERIPPLSRYAARLGLPLLFILAVLAGSVALAPVQPLSTTAPPFAHIISAADASPTAGTWSLEPYMDECEACRDVEHVGVKPEWKAIPPGGPFLPEWVEERGKPRIRQHYFVAQRAYPRDTLPAGALLKAWEQARREMRALRRGVAAPRWENIGPAPMRNSQIGKHQVNVYGRVTALAMDPRNGNVVYLGTALGGVWKTTDAGNTWTPLTDDQPSLAVGAIALAPSNPDIVYVGTGEPTPGLDNYYGVGLLKSTDGGRTWQHLGKDVFTGLGISAIVVHPNDPNTLYVATTRTGVMGPALPVRGVFLSRDGGRTWTGLIGCRDCWGASDLLMHPTNPNVLYAAFWRVGIFRSTDGGAKWSQLTQGLPGKNFGRIELAMAPSNPNVLYAGFEYEIPGKFVGGIVFKSTDAGASWTWLQKAPNYCTGQCWYDNIIAVHPRSAQTVYLGGSANYIWQPEIRIKEVVVRSTDGGTTWEDLSPNDSPDRTLHPDMHAIAFDPNNPNIVWIGNDGGVWRSTDGGRTWQNKNNGLATLQFTGIGVHPTNPSILFGGMQDNNKARTTGNRVWDALDVGDGGFAAIDPFNPNIYYGSRFGISFQRNDKGGSAPVSDWPMKIQGINKQDRALFYAPFALDPSTPGVIYYGTHRLYRTTDWGETWTAISPDLTRGERTRGRISAIAVAPSDPKTIYVGTSDGYVQVTTNTGQTWTNVSRPPLPNRWVSRIAVDPKNPNVAYVVYNGFNTHTPDTSGHVFKTTDRGASWKDISGNLPDVPVLSIALDSRAPGTIYIGTDIGVFRTTDDGRRWEPFGTGMPTTAVVDLVLHTQGNVLLAATHGRSVFRASLAAAAPPTPTPTRPAFTPRAFVYLPAMLKSLSSGAVVRPTPTPVRTLLPTATPTPIPTPTPTPTPTPVGPPPTPTPPPSPRVYYDGFDNPSSGWASGTVGVCQFAYTSGVYGIAVGQYNQICYATAPTTPRANGVFEVRVAKDNDYDGSAYGLIFGGDNAQNLTQFYIFWVDPAQQAYLLQRFDNGTWTNLTSVSASAAINRGNGVNVLKVRRQDDQITLYVNGVDLVTLRDNAFPGNGVTGIAAWAAYNASTAISYFDDFKITVPTVVMEDNFENPASGWIEDTTEVCQATYASGEYVTVTQPNWACVFRAPVGPYPNGSFQVTARQERNIYPVAYGITFGEDGTFSSLYAFLVVPATQEYALALYNGGWLALTRDPVDGDAWITSETIHAGEMPNTMKVVRDGTQIHLFVNGQYLETIRDVQLLGQGYFGLINWPSSYAPGTVYFDDFRTVVWDEPLTPGQPRKASRALARSDMLKVTPSTPPSSGRTGQVGAWPIPAGIQGAGPRSK